ncbi:MAG: Peptide methionine sulfoxide reductase MsrB [Candidatus Taylorbacteria bacterium]|nr:Peptide methionine sulfoxide reductase MsrB [Candidatus Taylorbacteria bacterium]
MKNSKGILSIIIVVGIILGAGIYEWTVMSGMKNVKDSLVTEGKDQVVQNAMVAPQVSLLKSKATTTSITKDSSLRTNEEWKKILSPDQYSVLREGGTESPYSSDLLHETRAGTFVTADCGEPVFRSETKFDSGTGWPSFFEPIKGSVVERSDMSLGIERTEVVSTICHSHLGHVFHDAPQTPTGDRYCMNGVALVFIPDKK